MHIDNDADKYNLKEDWMQLSVSHFSPSLQTLLVPESKSSDRIHDGVGVGVGVGLGLETKLVFEFTGVAGEP